MEGRRPYSARYGGGQTARRLLLALAIYVLIAASLTGPAVMGSGSLMPEGFLDRDLLYGRPAERAVLRPYEDAWPVVGDLGREQAVAQGLRQGRLDTWNPWIATGAPLWAEQGGALFPTKLLYYLNPRHSTLMASLGVRLVVAALGMFLLALALGLSVPAALFAGALFEYSGVLAAHLSSANSSSIYVLPWILLGAHKLCTAPGPAAAAFAGLALGVAGLGGHPSMVLLVYVGFVAFVIGAWLRTRPALSEMKRTFVFATIAGMIAVLVAAAALLPFAELVLHGYTYKSADVAESVWRDRLGWTRDVFPLALLFPSAITTTRDTMPFHLWPWAQGASIGLAALFVAAVGLKALRTRWDILLVAIVGISLTLAPIGLQWIHALPGLRIVLPWYCYSLIAVPLCLLAGFGLQTLAGTPRKTLVRVGIVLGVLWLACLAFLVFGGMPYSERRWFIIARSLMNMTLGLEVPVDPVRFGFEQLVDWRTFVSPGAALIAIAAAIALRGERSRRLVAVIAGVALVEAALIRIPTVTFERSAVLREGPSDATNRLQALLANGAWRFTAVPPSATATPNSGMLFDLRDLRSFSPLALRRFTGFLEMSKAGAEDPWKEPPFQYPFELRLPMLSLAAVRYVVYSEEYRHLFEIPAGLRERERHGEIVFLENPHAVPRFRVVHDVVAAADAQEAFDKLQLLLAEPAAEKRAWARSAVIEGVRPDPAAHREGSMKTPGEASVTAVSEPDPQTIVLDVRLDRPGFLIVADAFYPGWTATVDGVPAAVHPANLMFRAVHVPAGEHKVVMQYASSFQRLGGALSIAGILLAAVLFLAALRGFVPRLAGSERSKMRSLG